MESTGAGTRVGFTPTSPIELNNIVTTSGNRIFSIAEVDAGENLQAGIPPIFFDDKKIVLFEFDPNNGERLQSIDLLQDFGGNFVSSVNALAPLSASTFLAVAEFRIGNTDPGQDFVFTASLDGTTDSY